jgi:hypothetical protein
MTGASGLSRAEQQTRKALAKAVAGELKRQIRGTGWGLKQGWIFRQHAGWFIEVRVYVWVGEPRTTVELRAKPMGLDPVFWDIVDTPENREQPLSFRLFGAWTCGVPASVEAQIPEGDSQAAGIVNAVLAWADTQLIQTEPLRTLDGLIGRLRDQPRRGSYLASYITALILAHRRDEALAEIASAIERGEAAGFSVGTQKFPDMAKAWLFSEERGHVLH